MNPNLIENIDKLIKGTISGKIIWTKLNDNVFVWQTTNSDKTRLNVILQGYKIERNQITDILFRLYEVETKSSLLNIRTEDVSTEIKKKIFQLYQTIKDNFELGRLDVLSDLLKDL